MAKTATRRVFEDCRLKSTDFDDGPEKSLHRARPLTPIPQLDEFGECRLNFLLGAIRVEFNRVACGHLSNFSVKIMHPWFRVILLLLAGAGSISSANGAVFILSNGDRLTGELVAEDAESVTIQLALAGPVRIPRSALETRVVESAHAPSPTGSAEVAEQQPQPDPETQIGAQSVTAEALATADTAAAETPVSLFRRIPGQAYDAWEHIWSDNLLFRTLSLIYPLMDWENQLSFGYSLDSGETDDSKLDLYFTTNKRAGKHQTQISLQYEFDQQTITIIDDETSDQIKQTNTTRNWLRGNARYRYDFRKAFFIQSDSRYQRRLKKNINHEVSELVGLGYRWLDTDSIQGTITPSLGGGYSDVTPFNPKWNWLISIQQDFSIAFSEHVKLVEESTLTYTPTSDVDESSNDGDIAIVFSTGLENKLNERLSLILRYEYTFDESIEKARGRTSNGIRFTLGAKF